MDTSPFVKVRAPVLTIQGLNRTALLAEAVAADWEWFGRALTVAAVPGSRHRAENDQSELVPFAMKAWSSR